MEPGFAPPLRRRGHRTGMFWRTVGVLLALALAATGCAASPVTFTRSGPAPASPVATATFALATQRWVVVDAPTLTLAFDRAAATLLVLPPRSPAPADIAIREEATLGWPKTEGLLLREELATADGTVADDPDAPLPRVVATVAGNVAHLAIADIALGDAGMARWDVALHDGTLTLGRTVTLRRAVRDAEARLVLEPPPHGTDQRLLLLDGRAYLEADGLAETRGQLRGATIGALDVDRGGLLVTARSDEATSASVSVRDGHARLTLGYALAAGAGSVATNTTTLLFGPETHLQGVRSTFDPDLDARLLATGYYGNVVGSACCGPLLRASMTSYADAAWVRDLAFATRGYAAVLPDLGVLRGTIQAFLDRTAADGTVPEMLTGAGLGIRRGAWDSQPDLIHATYAYVASSGDVAFINHNRPALARIAAWLRASDTDGDGIPDRTDTPYGYYDTVANGVRHTYAIASFYAAYNELAELEDAAGRATLAGEYRADAARLRDAFARPVEAGGFWRAGQAYPVAWFTAEGRAVDGFETFGVLAALQGGLIPAGPRRDALVIYLHEHRADFVDGAPFGERLMLGGYDPEFRRDVVPRTQAWMLDASAPWIAGLDVPVRARLGQREDAVALLDHYLAAYAATPLPLPEYAAGANARYGAGQTPDYGRSWDNAAWFTIVYGGHYGLTPTPAALRIGPSPLRTIADDTVTGYRYGQAHLTLTLGDGTYTVRTDAPCALVLLPMGADAAIAVDGGPPIPQEAIQARAGHTYTVRSLADTAQTTSSPPRSPVRPASASHSYAAGGDMQAGLR